MAQKAQSEARPSVVKMKTSIAKTWDEDYCLNTIPNMVTSLLNDLRTKYVTGTDVRDIKMQERIEKVINIISRDSRLGGLLVQATPVMHTKNQGLFGSKFLSHGPDKKHQKLD